MARRLPIIERVEVTNAVRDLTPRGRDAASGIVAARSAEDGAVTGPLTQLVADLEVEGSGLEPPYQVILADPPWRYDFSKSDSRKIENQYPSLSLDELYALRPFIAALHDGAPAILFMWATAPKLADAIHLMGMWGFQYKTFDVWIKVPRDRERDQLVLAPEMRAEEAGYFGMGYYTRVRHEPLLIGTFGGFSPPEPAKRPLSAFYAEVARHSQKPEIAHQRIEAMYPDAKRVELFAREPREGWDAWGNEIE